MSVIDENVIEELSIEEAYKIGHHQFRKRIENASGTQRAGYSSEILHLANSKEYIENIFDMVRSNKPMTQQERADFEKRSDENLANYISDMQDDYHIKDLEEAYAIRVATVLMLEQGNRDAAIQTIQDYENHTTKFHRDKYTVMENFAFNVEHAQLRTILDLRIKANGRSEILQPLNQTTFDCIKYFR